ncbi:prepilin-type N-terminal cleavage/methylation domain-containing protein [Clostridium frigidicarnis]|uniref:Prepilin-type N-terminal cleavage/methylation domain-containing protein n=2 Tax=Clostridium frigidicarnis TaxID=84698 RepID=A0A1I1B3T4_9CLOT|nr:prepilin-type N-terminal cleavage/methylation domain-containing protein [Clostridium frigidicarnis]
MISIQEAMEKKICLIKHGFTLVEVIAAIAILSIIFVSISSFMLFSVKMESNSNSKVNKLSLVKSSMEVLNSSDDDSLLNKYTNGISYVYFDDLEELKNEMLNKNKNKFKDISSNTAKENNKENKKYSIALNVKKDTTKTEGIDGKDVSLYFIKAEIWDLSYDQDNAIIKETYISR